MALLFFLLCLYDCVCLAWGYEPLPARLFNRKANYGVGEEVVPARGGFRCA